MILYIRGMEDYFCQARKQFLLQKTSVTITNELFVFRASTLSPPTFAGHEGLTIDEMLREKSAATERGYLCLICGGTRTNLAGMKIHFRDLHFDSGIIYRCPICQKDFKSRHAFACHMSRLHRDLKGLDLNRCTVK